MVDAIPDRLLSVCSIYSTTVNNCCLKNTHYRWHSCFIVFKQRTGAFKVGIFKHIIIIIMQIIILITNIIIIILFLYDVAYIICIIFVKHR